jgi:malonate transporter and related proteins
MRRVTSGLSMIANIIGTLLPTVTTLLFGFFAGWHHDFDAKEAAVLNRMVMLYALPLSLSAGMVGIGRDQVLSQGPLAFAVLLGMAGGYAIVFFISHHLLRCDLMTASLEALAISGPAVPFIGASVLGHLFGNASAIPISIASLVMNLIQVPATLLLLSAGTAQKTNSLGGHIIHALRQPVVWALLLAVVLILFDLHSVLKHDLLSHHDGRLHLADQVNKKPCNSLPSSLASASA